MAEKDRKPKKEKHHIEPSPRQAENFEFIINHQTLFYLTCSSSWFWRCSLGSLLADLLAPGSTGSGLCLLGLLLALGSSLLLLSGLDGGSTVGPADIGVEGTLLLDDVQRGTDDGTLVLDGLAASLLGNFL